MRVCKARVRFCMQQVDLDLGNYERFLDITLTRDNNLTTGKVYQVCWTGYQPGSISLQELADILVVCCLRCRIWKFLCDQLDRARSCMHTGLFNGAGEFQCTLGFTAAWKPNNMLGVVTVQASCLWRYSVGSRV